MERDGGGDGRDGDGPRGGGPAGPGPAPRYLDDLAVGDVVTAGSYEVTRDEIIAFATKWDPLPFHVDEERARRSPHGSLVASGSHVMAIRTWLLHRIEPIAIIAALGWDAVRFLDPVRPGDRLSLEVEFLEVRPSRSKPDRGVVRSRIAVKNQDGHAVLEHEDVILVARKPAPAG